MVKNIFSFLLLTFIYLGSNKAFAQIDSVKKANEVKTKLVTTVCSCISKSDVANIKTADAAEQLMMTCFMGEGMSMIAEYASLTGVSLTDMDKLQSMMQAIGIELSFSCPALQQAMLNISKDEKEVKKLMEKQEMYLKQQPAQ